MVVGRVKEVIVGLVLSPWLAVGHYEDWQKGEEVSVVTSLSSTSTTILILRSSSLALTCSWTVTI